MHAVQPNERPRAICLPRASDNAAFDHHRPMLRITELRLPLNHADDALSSAIVKRLGIADADLKGFKVFKRSHDARKKHAMLFIYTVDCELHDESAVLARFEGDRHIVGSPDTSYRFVDHAPADFYAVGR